MFLFDNMVESPGIEPGSHALQACAGMTTLAHSPSYWNTLTWIWTTMSRLAPYPRDNVFQYGSSFIVRGSEDGVCRLLTIYPTLRGQQTRVPHTRLNTPLLQLIHSHVLSDFIWRMILLNHLQYSRKNFADELIVLFIFTFVFYLEIRSFGNISSC